MSLEILGKVLQYLTDHRTLRCNFEQTESSIGRVMVPTIRDHFPKAVRYLMEMEITYFPERHMHPSWSTREARRFRSFG